MSKACQVNRGVDGYEVKIMKDFGLLGAKDPSS